MDNSQFEKYLVKKNAFSRKNHSLERFQDYFDEIISVIHASDSIESKVDYLKEAETALDIFGEKTRLNSRKITAILASRTKIGDEYSQISDMITKYEEDHSGDGLEHVDELSGEEIRKNDSVLYNLSIHKTLFSNVKSQKDLDAYLDKLQGYEDSLNKENLTKEQKKNYSTLCDDFSKLISDAMERFSFEKEKQYNDRAMSSFKSVFDNYKAKEKKLKDVDDEFHRVVNPLYGYDSNRLFPEVQVYYNHVFSYIFSKLKDDDRYSFVRMSLDAVRKF